jgi:hypothetical protein
MDIFGVAIYLDLFTVIQSRVISIFEQPKSALENLGKFSLFGDPFLVAVMFNRTKILRILLDNLSTGGISIERIRIIEEECLFHATQAGHINSVNLLLNGLWASYDITITLEDKRYHQHDMSRLDYVLDCTLVTPNRDIFTRILEYRQQTSLKRLLSPAALWRIALHIFQMTICICFDGFKIPTGGEPGKISPETISYPWPSSNVITLETLG